MSDAVDSETHPPGTGDHITALEDLLFDAPDWIPASHSVDETLIFLEAWNRWRDQVMSYMESVYEIPDTTSH